MTFSLSSKPLGTWRIDAKTLRRWLVTRSSLCPAILVMLAKKASASNTYKHSLACIIGRSPPFLLSCICSSSQPPIPAARCAPRLA